MCKFSLLFCFLVSALAASAQVLTDKTGVMVQSTSYFQGSCSSGRVGRSSETGQTYFCSGGTWKSVDLPECVTSPPSGACTGSATCIASVANAPYLYTCNSGTWALISGTGGAGATPGGSSGQAQFNSNPTTLGGSSSITFNTTSGAMTTLTVPTAPWALPADGGFYCDPNTDCAFASGGTFYPLMGKWQYDVNNDGTVDQALNVINAPPFRQYQDYDTDKDGITDLRIVGDFNGDGSLTLSDIQSALCTLQGMTVAASGGGNAGDESTCTGVPTSGRRTLRILPGNYVGTYRQELKIAGDNVSIEGSGRDTTTLSIGGTTTACGQAASVDDGDGAVESRNLFRISGDNFSMADLTIDGSSQRWAYVQPRYRNAYDCDGNGVQGDTNDCANSCTKDVHDLVIFTDTAKNATFTNVAFKNADARAIQGDSTSNTCSGTEQTHLTIQGCLFSGTAEHAVTAQFDTMTIVGNIFENCSSAYCVHLYEGTTDVTVSGNVFKEFSGAAIGRETNGGTVCSPSAAKRFVVADNTILSTTAPVGTPPSSGVTAGIGAITFLADADEAFSDISITGNVIDVNGSYHNAGISLGASGISGNARIAVTGNTVRYAPANGGNDRTEAGILYAADGGVVAGNMIDVTGDGTGAASFFENGINLLSARDVTVSANTVTMRGVGVVGYYLYDSLRTTTDSMQIVDYSNTSSTAATGVAVSGSSTANCYDNMLSGAHYSLAGTGSNTTAFNIGANCAHSIVTDVACYNNASWCLQNHGAGTILRNVSITGTGNSVYEGGTAVWLGNVYRSRSFSTTGGYNATVYSDHGFDMLVDEDGDGTLDTNSKLRLLSATNKVRYQGATAGQYTDISFAPVSGTATITAPHATGTMVLNDVAAAGAVIGKYCADASGTGTVTIDGCNYVNITGGSAITTLNTCNAANKGRVLTAFCGASTTAGFTDGSNLKLAGSFTCTADDSITLICDGTNWIERSRSVN